MNCQLNTTQRSTVLPKTGTTLVELIVTLTIASSLFLMATAWIHQSLFLSSKLREVERHHHESMRLSRQFRDDVYFADSAELQDDFGIKLINDDREVRYFIRDSRVTRRVQRQPAKQTRKLPTIQESDSDEEPSSAQETYRFRDGSGIAISIDETDPAAAWVMIAVLRSVPQPESGLTRPTDLFVRSQVGRFRKDQP